MFGFAFAFTLLAIVFVAALPDQYFLVSSRAMINAPVQQITSQISGRITNMDLQIGQDVLPGQVVAKVENFDIDASLLVSLRRERLELSDQLSRIRSKEARTAQQLGMIRAQLRATQRGVVEDLAASTKAAENSVSIYEARVGEQQSLVDQKMSLVRAGILDARALTPLRHKLAAALQELETAKGELAHRRSIAASIQAGNYAGGAATNLMVLELQAQALDLEHTDAAAQLAGIQERIAELDALIEVAEARITRESAASVVAQHAGRIVSIQVAPGDYTVQGGLIARSLDCSKSFVAAVFAGRDVAELEVDTPALVNIRSLSTKHRGRIAKTVRYYTNASETLYYKAFPKADGHEIYVIVELDGRGDPVQPVDDDLFFGCYVGEEVTVALGEMLTERAVRVLGEQQKRVSEMVRSAGAGMMDVVERAIGPAIQGATASTRPDSDGETGRRSSEPETSADRAKFQRAK